MRRQIRVLYALPITCALLMSQAALSPQSVALGQEQSPFSQMRILNDQLKKIEDVSQVAAIVARIADLASKGDPEANQTLGDFYSKGGIANIDVDGEKAVRHYRASAEAGNAMGYLRLGELYREGAIVMADPALAFQNFQKAADAGLLLGQFRLAEAYIDGIGTKVDPEKGISLFAKAAAAGDPWASYRLGDIYSKGGIAGVDIDGEKAVKYYASSAEDGNAWGHYRLGEIYRDGKIVKADAGLAFRNFQKAADAGLAPGQFRLGEAYVDGIGTKVDIAKGMSLMTAAADAGDTWDNQRLGDMFSKGGIADVDIDGDKAVKYYASAARAGNPWGYYRLGELFREGSIVKSDPAQSFRNFRQAADAGLVMGKIRLGEAYINGLGTPTDKEKGLSILNEAAAHGDPWANQTLGDLYSRGGAIAMDGRKAIEYYRASAAAGNAWADLRLGELYRDGIVVKADAALAFQSFKKASDAGLAMGKLRLGEAYLQGIGVVANGRKGIALVEEGVADQDKWNLPILGDYLSGGYYAKPDMKTAISIYEKAGKAGNGWAYLRLGQIHSDKRGSIYNPAKALEYFKLATDMGIDEAQIQVAFGHIYRSFGKLSKRSEGVKLLEDLAEKEDPDAIVALAVNKFWGIGVKRNPKGAVEMLEKASAEGNVEATRQLIKIYRDRSGGRVKRSIPKAEAILENHRGQFSPSQYEREDLLMAAAKTKNVKKFSEISKRILDMPPATYLDTLVALKEVNSNAFIYFAQQQMKKRKLYAGPVDGMLTKPTIEAIRKLCVRKGLSKKCKHGPLDNEAARTISLLIDPNRLLH